MEYLEVNSYVITTVVRYRANKIPTRLPPPGALVFCRRPISFFSGVHRLYCLMVPAGDPLPWNGLCECPLSTFRVVGPALLQSILIPAFEENANQVHKPERKQ